MRALRYPPSRGTRRARAYARIERHRNLSNHGSSCYTSCPAPEQVITMRQTALALALGLAFGLTAAPPHRAHAQSGPVSTEATGDVIRSLAARPNGTAERAAL